MFTLETAIDTYTQNAKQVLSYVQHETVRKNLTSLADKQADFAKGLNKLTTDYVEFVTKSFQNK